MKDYYVENAIKTRAVYCTDEGVVFVEDLVRKQILYKFDIFGDRYKYLLYNWLIRPCFFFSPDEKWLIITYGMGYIYFVELATGMICERIRLFEDVDYDSDSFKAIDTCCYYNEYTQIDFSSSGRYMCARVRGDFDFLTGSVHWIETASDAHKQRNVGTNIPELERMLRD